MESILGSIKKLLGIEDEYDAFDTDIKIHINSNLMLLNQLGVGPEEGFSIIDESQTWYDFLGDSKQLLEAVETYVYIKVKIVFDPPTSSFVLEALKQQADEWEWRIREQITFNKLTPDREG